MGETKQSSNIRDLIHEVWYQFMDIHPSNIWIFINWRNNPLDIYPDPLEKHPCPTSNDCWVVEFPWCKRVYPNNKEKKEIGGHDKIIREDIMFPLCLFGKKNMRYTSWHGHITNNYQQIKNQSWNMTGTNRQQSWSHANTGVWWLKMSTNITTKPILTRHSLWDNYPNMVSWLRHHGKQNDKQRMNIQEKTWCQRLQHESFLDVSDLRSS